MRETTNHSISAKTAHTLDGLFRERIRLTPDAIAYRSFDKTTQQWLDHSWQDMADYVSRWQTALKKLKLSEGDRVALILKNSPDWIAVDQAILGLGLAGVPLYTDDRPEIGRAAGRERVGRYV